MAAVCIEGIIVDRKAVIDKWLPAKEKKAMRWRFWNLRYSMQMLKNSTDLDKDDQMAIRQFRKDLPYAKRIITNEDKATFRELEPYLRKMARSFRKYNIVEFAHVRAEFHAKLQSLPKYQELKSHERKEQFFRALKFVASKLADDSDRIRKALGLIASILLGIHLLLQGDWQGFKAVMGK